MHPALLRLPVPVENLLAPHFGGRHVPDLIGAQDAKAHRHSFARMFACDSHWFSTSSWHFDYYKDEIKYNYTFGYIQDNYQQKMP